MHTFTLDTNCVIAVDDGRPEASAVRTLADAHAAGRARVAVVAISASEKQRDSGYIRNFAEFQQRLGALGLGHLEILMPLWYLDITYLDWCVISGPDLELLEKKIHEVLFPNVEFHWKDYCLARGLDPAKQFLVPGWRNPKCDVLALWSHIFQKRDVFVTSDHNFHTSTKKPRLIALGANRIEYPDTAVSLI